MHNEQQKVRGNDLTGMRFGRLVANYQLPPIHPRDGYRWNCICDCGNSCIVRGRLLTYKKGTRSCGCITAELNRAKPKKRPSTNIKHGHSSRGQSPEYITWSSMIQRCTNKNHPSFHTYGGRGIDVCNSWRLSFEEFIKDMGMKPSEKHSIDRIDNEKGYSPDNCRWSSQEEQATNRRNNVYCLAFGEKLAASQAARKFNIKPRTLYNWIASNKFDDIGEKIISYLAKRQ